MNHRAVIYRMDGTKETVMFQKGHSYDRISGAVGGLIECVRLNKLDLDMWTNEEGKYTCEYQNPRATGLLFREWGPRDYIMGDVFFANTDEEGETVGLRDDQYDFLMKYEGFVKIKEIALHPGFPA